MLIQAQQANQLIIFFNGWGMDETIVEHLSNTCFDVMMFNNYHLLNNKDFCIPKHYKKYYLIAWSMGVWASGLFPILKNIKFKKSIAINGTRQPISNKEGIPTAIFQTTLNTLNQVNKDKFDRHLFDSKEHFNHFRALAKQRSLENQKEELEYISNHANEKQDHLYYSDIYIGKYDVIFPCKNQLNHWGKNHYKLTPWSHCPFFEFQSWSDIINLNLDE